MNKILLISMGGLLLTSFNVHSREYSRKEFENQGLRIQQGSESGELTKNETKVLNQEQKDMKDMKQEAQSDGVITKKEEKQIKKARKKASKNIYKHKHDGEMKKVLKDKDAI